MTNEPKFLQVKKKKKKKKIKIVLNAFLIDKLLLFTTIKEFPRC